MNVAASVGGWTIELDGQTAATAGGRRLLLPTEALASLIAGEWRDRDAPPDHRSMPATRLASTAIDILPGSREAYVRRLANYAGVDLLCYFAEAPKELVQRHEAIWSPILDWADSYFGYPFRRASGVAPQEQSSAVLAGVEAKALATSDLDLAGLAAAADLFGSAILAFALGCGRLTGADALAASRIDEVFQVETWGEDAEIAERSAAMAQEAQMLDQWFRALA